LTINVNLGIDLIPAIRLSFTNSNSAMEGLTLNDWPDGTFFKGLICALDYDVSGSVLMNVHHSEHGYFDPDELEMVGRLTALDRLAGGLPGSRGADPEEDQGDVMDKLTDAQLAALYRRCVKAVGRGYLIAHASQLINQLGKETGVRDVPAETKKGSAAHLLALVVEAKAQRDGKPKPKAKKVAPAPPPPPEPEPEPESEPAPASEPADDEDDVPYEEWTKKELYDLATDREIDGRGGMNKDELIAVLEEWDAEHPEG